MSPLYNRLRKWLVPPVLPLLFLVFDILISWPAVTERKKTFHQPSHFVCPLSQVSYRYTSSFPACHSGFEQDNHKCATGE